MLSTGKKQNIFAAILAPKNTYSLLKCVFHRWDLDVNVVLPIEEFLTFDISVLIYDTPFNASWPCRADL